MTSLPGRALSGPPGSRGSRYVSARAKIKSHVRVSTPLPPRGAPLTGARAQPFAGRVAGVPPDRFPLGFGAGVRLFNAGDFFAAHEVFEELLDAAEGSDCWGCLVALIQVAVGYHKCVAGHPGAARMLNLGAAKLAPFPAVFRRVAVDRLRRRRAE